MCNYFLLFSERLKTANKTWVKDLKLRRQWYASSLKQRIWDNEYSLTYLIQDSISSYPQGKIIDDFYFEMHSTNTLQGYLL